MIPLEAPTCDDRLIWDVWFSQYHFSTLVVADQIGLFSRLSESPLTRAEVAREWRMEDRAAEAMLGVLTSLGLLTLHADRFHLTDPARNFLLPEGPYYWGGMLHRGRTAEFTEEILDAVLHSGQLTRLTDTWEEGKVDLEVVVRFTEAMHSHSFPAAMGVARHGDFAGVKRLLDIGGGSGCFCIALALRHPDLRCTVMDLPEVCELAQRYAAEYSASGQVDTVARDMFTDAWPQGYDAHFFSNVFHDWEPERNRRLARTSFEALEPGGRIYLHEMLLNDDCAGPLPSTAFSMAMLLRTRGKQPSAAELKELLSEAGFTDFAVANTYGYYSLVSARKPLQGLA